MAQQQDHSFKIDENGNWFHNNGPINRKALAKLFADKGLKRDEDGNYWMQSPFEKYPVEVVDVPFLIVDYEETDGGVNLITNMEECVRLGAQDSLELREYAKEKTELPYIHVRDGLYARLNRSVYYGLIEKFGLEFESRREKQVLGELGDDDN